MFYPERRADLAARPVRLLGGDHFDPVLLLEAAGDCLAVLSLDGYLNRDALALHANCDRGVLVHFHYPLLEGVGRDRSPSLLVLLVPATEGFFRDEFVSVLLCEGVDFIPHCGNLRPLPGIEVHGDACSSRRDRYVDPALLGDCDSRFGGRSLEGLVLGLELEDQFHKLFSRGSGGLRVDFRHGSLPFQSAGPWSRGPLAAPKLFASVTSIWPKSPTLSNQALIPRD